MSLIKKMKCSLMVGGVVAAIAANSALAALPATGKCAMLANVAKPYFLPSWAGTITGLTQQQPLNTLAIIDFSAKTVTTNGELFAFFDPTVPGTIVPFRRFHLTNIGMNFTDVTSQQGASLSVYTIEFNIPVPAGGTFTVNWNLVPTNGGNTILVQGASSANAVGTAGSTSADPGLYGMSGVCQMM